MEVATQSNQTTQQKTKKLLKCQDVIVKTALKGKTALITANMGTGKTYIASEIIKRLCEPEGGCNFAVLVKKALMGQWESELKSPNMEVVLVDKEAALNDILQKENEEVVAKKKQRTAESHHQSRKFNRVIIINSDIFKAGLSNKKQKRLETRCNSSGYSEEFKEERIKASLYRRYSEEFKELMGKMKMLVVDEIHEMLKSENTDIYDALNSLRDKLSHKIFLTGTPMYWGVKSITSQFKQLEKIDEEQKKKLEDIRSKHLKELKTTIASRAHHLCASEPSEIYRLLCDGSQLYNLRESLTNLFEKIYACTTPLSFDESFEELHGHLADPKKISLVGESPISVPPLDELEKKRLEASETPEIFIQRVQTHLDPEEREKLLKKSVEDAMKKEIVFLFTTATNSKDYLIEMARKTHDELLKERFSMMNPENNEIVCNINNVKRTKELFPDANLKISPTPIEGSFFVPTLEFYSELTPGIQKELGVKKVFLLSVTEAPDALQGYDPEVMGVCGIQSAQRKIIESNATIDDSIKTLAKYVEEVNKDPQVEEIHSIAIYVDQIKQISTTIESIERAFPGWNTFKEMAKYHQVAPPQKRILIFWSPTGLNLNTTQLVMSRGINSFFEQQQIDARVLRLDGLTQTHALIYTNQNSQWMQSMKKAYAIQANLEMLMTLNDPILATEILIAQIIEAYISKRNIYGTQGITYLNIMGFLNEYEHSQKEADRKEKVFDFIKNKAPVADKDSDLTDSLDLLDQEGALDPVESFGF